MTVNQAAWSKVCASVTNSTTVLSELMQNARRAQASQINFNFCPETKTLQISDDGCGIESIESLLAVAESGWDAELIAQEHCFGIGFLSALFACRHISVISKSGSIDVDTDAILAFKPVTILPVQDWDGLTVITLFGMDLDSGNILSALRRFASGFPIPVIFNGEVLERTAALDCGLDFIPTEVGHMHLIGFDKPGNGDYEFDVYLQGLPIYKSHSYSRNPQYHAYRLCAILCASAGS